MIQSAKNEKMESDFKYYQKTNLGHQLQEAFNHYEQIEKELFEISENPLLDVVMKTTIKKLLLGGDSLHFKEFNVAKEVKRLKSR